jgi:hypothetical protein
MGEGEAGGLAHALAAIAAIRRVGSESGRVLQA